MASASRDGVHTVTGEGASGIGRLGLGKHGHAARQPSAPPRSSASLFLFSVGRCEVGTGLGEEAEVSLGLWGECEANNARCKE
jgi:hypothetical protein